MTTAAAAAAAAAPAHRTDKHAAAAAGAGRQQPPHGDEVQSPQHCALQHQRHAPAQVPQAPQAITAAPAPRMVQRHGTCHTAAAEHNMRRQQALAPATTAAARPTLKRVQQAASDRADTASKKLRPTPAAGLQAPAACPAWQKPPTNAAGGRQSPQLTSSQPMASTRNQLHPASGPSSCEQLWLHLVKRWSAGSLRSRARCRAPGSRQHLPARPHRDAPPAAPPPPPTAAATVHDHGRTGTHMPRKSTNHENQTGRKLAQARHLPCAASAAPVATCGW
jgi:hypothetical protein